MQSWPEVAVPRLPGTPPPLRLWDTATRRLQPVGDDRGTATLYVCGITPYDATHLGHALTYLVFDTLVRALRDAGRAVRYTQNVTDVDEPLFERAARDGVDWRVLGSEQIALFRSDMTALRVLPPTDYVGAMEAMPTIAELVGRLPGAYPVGPDWYDAVTAPDRGLGRSSGLPREEMLALSAERGGDPQRPGKRDPLDPVVWRGPVEGEPQWDSPRGPGRPGWHVECAAIALATLGEQVDVQGGGVDLLFPHHEMSGLHAEAVTGKAPFARCSVHVEHLAYDGHKMSKSRGNLVFVSRLLAGGADPGAVRLALLAHHHRHGWEWTGAALEQATARLGTWRTAVDRCRETGAGPAGGPVLAAVRAALADDLDTPAALAAVDGWAELALADRPGEDPAAAGTVADLVDALLGVTL